MLLLLPSFLHTRSSRLEDNYPLFKDKFLLSQAVVAIDGSKVA